MRRAVLPLTAEAEEARKRLVRHGCEEQGAFRMEKRCLDACFFLKKNEIQCFTRKLGLNLKDAKTSLSPLILPLF
jgi:hypothetical protein